jgi:hypothetical protein
VPETAAPKTTRQGGVALKKPAEAARRHDCSPKNGTLTPLDRWRAILPRFREFPALGPAPVTATGAPSKSRDLPPRHGHHGGPWERRHRRHRH